MPKDLNEAIDALFRGLVFIIYDYVASIARIALRPVRGCVLMVRRLSAPNMKQIGPYAFMFMSFFVGLSIPYYFSRIANIYVAKFPPSSQNSTSIQQAYASALDIFEPKFVLATTLSCLIMSVILDSATSVIASACGRTHMRRLLIKNSLMYLAGFQIVTITVAIVIVFFYQRGWTLSDTDPYRQSAFFSTFQDAVRATLALEHGWELLLSMVVYATGIALFLYALTIPVLLLRAFLTGQRRPIWAKRAPVSGLIAASATFFIVITGTYELGSWIIEGIRPVSPTELAVSDVSCTRPREHPDSIVATAMITNPTSSPKAFHDYSLKIWLVVKLTPKEAALRAAQTPADAEQELSDQDMQLSRKKLAVNILKSSEGIDRPIYLVSPGQSMWLQAKTDQPVTPFEYAENDLLNCGVAFGSDPGAIVAYGLVDDEGSSYALTSKALRDAPVQPAATPKCGPRHSLRKHCASQPAKLGSR